MGRVLPAFVIPAALLTGTVCAESGMPASPYCPNPVQKGVVTIPAGHPLYSLLGTQYQSVVEEYLGISAAYSDTVCTLHDSSSQGPSSIGSQQYSEANQLLGRAENMLKKLDSSGQQYQAVRNAADYLRMLLGGSDAGQAEIIAAMTALTNAMAGIY